MNLKLTVLTQFLTLFFLLQVASYQSFAQQFESPVAYLDFMNKQQEEILKDYMSYNFAMANNKSARKIENRRKELIQTLVGSKNRIAAMPAYNNDPALRDSLVSYMEKTLHVYNDDLGKVVDLEEVAEQSYDGMEAYFKAQDLANDKLHEANSFVNEQWKKFAKKNNINLVDSESELGKRLEKASAVNKYQRELFLIKFKCSNQERYLIEAFNTKDINAIEQNKNNLAKYAEENLKKLTTVKSFDNDGSLIAVCKEMLLFYQSETKTQIPVMLDFIVKEDNFNKIKKAFEAKKESERTQTDVDTYNKAVNDMNTSVQKYNAANKTLNEKRKMLFDKWEKASNKFLATHTPK